MFVDPRCIRRRGQVSLKRIYFLLLAIFTLAIVVSLLHNNGHGNKINRQFLYRYECKVDDSLRLKEKKKSNWAANRRIPFRYPIKEMPYALSYDDYMIYMKFVDEVASLLLKWNVTFSMGYGTLLGSFIMHDMIPWDDDVDFMVKFSDIPTIVQMCNSQQFREKFGIAGFHDRVDFYKSKMNNITISMSQPSNNESHLLSEYRILAEKLRQFPDSYNPNWLRHKLQFKIFLRKNKPIGKLPWSWPFIDFQYFLENSTHVWTMTSKRLTIYWEKKVMYPLYKRPYGPLFLPAPSDTGKWLKIKYKTFICKENGWKHKEERRKKIVHKANCTQLMKYFPFINRYMNSTHVIERQVIGNATYNSFCIQETFPTLKVWPKHTL